MGEPIFIREKYIEIEHLIKLAREADGSTQENPAKKILTLLGCC
jgi:hypothetical protein